MFSTTDWGLKIDAEILRRFRSAVASAPMTSFYGVADQALLSATNFVIGMFFIHFATKEEYGLYSLAYGVLTLMISFSGALIITPMTVSYADRPQDRRAAYGGSMLVGLYGVFGPVAVSSLVLLLALSYFGIIKHDSAQLLMILTIATLCGMLWEFSRRYHYLRLQPGQVLYWDAWYAILMVVGITAVSYINVRGMYWLIFVLYGFAAAGTGCFALAKSEISLTPDWHSATSSVREAWAYGRWALGGVLVTWVQSQSYAYFLAIFSDLSSVADANAARLLVSPLMLLNAGLTNVLFPKLVFLRSEKRFKETEQVARRLVWILSGLFLVYTSVVGFAGNKLTGLILGDRYTGIEIFIIAWAAVNLLTALRANTSVLLQVFKEFKTITLANVVSVVIVLVVTWPLMNMYGVIGSIGALAIGEIVLAILLWRAFRHVRETYTR